MKPVFLRALLPAAIISAPLLPPAARAQLPFLHEQPWLGYFAAYGGRGFNVGMTPQAELMLFPFNAKDEPVGQKLAINIHPGVIETLPDGRTVIKEIKLDSLESSDNPTAPFEKATIRGKVTGGTGFEIRIEQTRGIIFVCGKLLDPGTATKNPLRFAVRVTIPSAYPYIENKPASSGDDDGRKDKKARDSEKAFVKKLKDDSLEVRWTDGTRVKRDYEQLVDATSREINGPGITSAEIRTGAYKERRIVFTASPGSAMTLRNPKPRPLHEGFMIFWDADPVKDPDGKARLAIEVK